MDVDGAYRSNDWQTQKNGVVLDPKLTANQTFQRAPLKMATMGQEGPEYTSGCQFINRS